MIAQLDIPDVRTECDDLTDGFMTRNEGQRYAPILERKTFAAA
jgi:hypothetical protein